MEAEGPASRGAHDHRAGDVGGSQSILQAKPPAQKALYAEDEAGLVGRAIGLLPPEHSSPERLAASKSKA